MNRSKRFKNNRLSSGSETLKFNEEVAKRNTGYPMPAVCKDCVYWRKFGGSAGMFMCCWSEEHNGQLRGGLPGEGCKYFVDRKKMVEEMNRRKKGKND